MKPDGSDAHRITEPGGDDVAPAWSPDGRYIVFARRQRLMIMRADGSAVRSLGLSGSPTAVVSGDAVRALARLADRQRRYLERIAAGGPTGLRSCSSA